MRSSDGAVGHPTLANLLPPTFSYLLRQRRQTNLCQNGQPWPFARLRTRIALQGKWTAMHGQNQWRHSQPGCPNRGQHHGCPGLNRRLFPFLKSPGNNSAWSGTGGFPVHSTIAFPVFDHVLTSSVIVLDAPIFEGDSQFLKGDDYATDPGCRGSGIRPFFSRATTVDNIQIRSKSWLRLWLYRLLDTKRRSKTAHPLSHV